MHIRWEVGCRTKAFRCVRLRPAVLKRGIQAQVLTIEGDPRLMVSTVKIDRNQARWQNIGDVDAGTDALGDVERDSVADDLPDGSRFSRAFTLFRGGNDGLDRLNGPGSEGDASRGIIDAGAIRLTCRSGGCGTGVVAFAVHWGAAAVRQAAGVQVCGVGDRQVRGNPSAQGRLDGDGDRLTGIQVFSSDSKLPVRP